MRSTTRRDVLLAAGALACGLVLLAAGAYGRWDVDRPAAGPAWRILPLVLVCTAMLFRRTAPLPALVAATPVILVDVALGPALATAFVYTDLLYAVAVYGPRRAVGRLLGSTIAITVVVAAAVGLVFTTLSGLVVVGAILALSLVSPVLSGLVVRQHRDNAEMQRLRAEQVATLAEFDRRAAVAAERAQMARELHDVIANELSAVALHSSAILKMPDMGADDVRRALTVIRESSVRGLAEMRRMIVFLRAREDLANAGPVTPDLDEIGQLVEQLGRPDLKITFEVLGTLGELPAAVELAAYRIVQESLTNVLKHAGPGRGELLVDHRADVLVITMVSPLGRRDTALEGSGAGLVGMRERAVLLGGTFTAGPSRGHWRVRAELPVGAAPGAER